MTLKEAEEIISLLKSDLSIFKAYLESEKATTERLTQKVASLEEQLNREMIIAIQLRRRLVKYEAN